VADIGCVVPEEWWVDYHLNRLTPERQASLERHRAVCPVCAETSRRWAELLDRVRKTRTAAPSAGGTALPESRSDPQAVVFGEVRPRPDAPRLWWKRRAMRAAVWFYGWRRRTARALRARGRLAAAGGAFAALLLAGLIRVAFPHEAGINPVLTKAEAYVQQHEPMAARVISLPDTVQYPLGASDRQGMFGPPPVAAGAVWVNGRTGELFVLLEGLLPSDSRDVQAWGVVRQERHNLGLLQFHERLGHLYVRHAWMDGWEAVAFTIEPKGGSPQPTAPETAIVRLLSDPRAIPAKAPVRP
jgi:hypothetical protein